MKRINCTLLLMFSVCVLVFSSCKNDNTNIPIPQTAATSISLKFSGNQYTSTAATAIYNKNLDAIQIGSLLGVTAYINLIIPNVKVGTFDLSGGDASLSFYNGTTSVPDTFFSTSGSIVISEFTNTTIVGTFQFTGVDSLNVTRPITEGQFTTSYTTQ